MKKRTFKKLFALLFLVYAKVWGCDICGCSINGSYFGLLPQYRKHFLGLRTNYRSYQIKHPPLFAGEKLIYSNDLALSTEIWGKYQVNNKWQLLVAIPYQYNERKEESIKLTSHGLSDVTLNGMITIWRTSDSVKSNYRHSILLGAGVKIPTGSHHDTIVYKGLRLPGFQIGTGSWDFPLSFLYTLKRKSLGLNMEMTYLFNTKNRYGYQMGNRFSSALRFFYWKYEPSMSFLPQIGFSYESFLQDKKENQWVRYTGGNAVWSLSGIDIYKGRWGLGFSAWYPVYQNMGEQYIKMLPRLQTQLLFLF